MKTNRHYSINIDQNQHSTIEKHQGNGNQYNIVQEYWKGKNDTHNKEWKNTKITQNKKSKIKKKENKNKETKQTTTNNNNKNKSNKKQKKKKSQKQNRTKQTKMIERYSWIRQYLYFYSFSVQTLESINNLKYFVSIVCYCNR